MVGAYPSFLGAGSIKAKLTFAPAGDGAEEINPHALSCQRRTDGDHRGDRGDPPRHTAHPAARPPPLHHLEGWGREEVGMSGTKILFSGVHIKAGGHGGFAAQNLQVSVHHIGIETLFAHLVQPVRQLLYKCFCAHGLQPLLVHAPSPPFGLTLISICLRHS